MSAELIQFLTTPDGIRPEKSMGHNEKKDTFGVFEVKVDKITGKRKIQEYSDVTLADFAAPTAASTACGSDFVLRMVCIPVIDGKNQYLLDVKEGTYLELLRVLGLQDVRDLAHTSGMTFDVLPHSTNVRTAELSYSFLVSYYAGLYFRHINDNNAVGMIWSHDGSDKGREESLRSYKLALRQFDALARNPCYALFSLLSHILKSTDARMAKTRNEVNIVEAHTGYEVWGDMRLTYNLPTSAIEAHLDSYIANLTGMASAIASHRRFMFMAQKITTAIREQESLGHFWVEPERPSIPEHDLTLLEKRTTMHLYQCDILEARIRNQISAVSPPPRNQAVILMHTTRYKISRPDTK